MSSNQLIFTSKLFKESFIVFIGVVLSTVFNFVGLKLLTTYSSPEVIGEVSLFLTVITFTQLLFYSPILNANSRFLPIALEKKQFYQLKFEINYLLKNASFVFIIIAVLCSLVYNKFFLQLVTITLYAILMAYSNYYLSVETSLRNRIKVTLINVLDKLLKYFFPILIITHFTNNSINLITGYFIGLAFLILIQYFSQTTPLENHVKSQNIYQNEILSYASPFIYWGVFCWLQTSSERWALGYFSSAENVGYYSIINQLGFQSVTIFTGIISTIILPILYQISAVSDSNGNENAIEMNNKLSIAYIILMLFLFIIVYLFSFEITNILVGKSFSKYYFLLPYSFLSGILFNTGQLIANNFTIVLKPKLLLNIKINTALIGIILNILLTYFFQLEGVVYSSLLFSLIYLVWILILNQNLQKHQESESFSI